MARTRGDRERFAKEQEEFFRRMHAEAPFQLLWWHLRNAFRTAARVWCATMTDGAPRPIQTSRAPTLQPPTRRDREPLVAPCRVRH